MALRTKITQALTPRLFAGIRPSLQSYRWPVACSIPSTMSFHASRSLRDDKASKGESQGAIKGDQAASPLFTDVTKELIEKITSDESKVTTKAPVSDAEAAALRGALGELEYSYSTTNFKYSPRKLRFLSNQISGLDIDEAIKQMRFSAKKPAKKIMHSLISARHNAILQKHMNGAKLYVAQAWVGKGQYLKRYNFHGRGRTGIMHHPKSHMKYVLRERQPPKHPGAKIGLEDIYLSPERKMAKGFKLQKRVFVPMVENQPIRNPSKYYNW
ncbi:ribosomal protein L22 [Ramicandelaber brevisporus]|nr:ribosomal protein L22 [Ramicandelaber brevisporus]